MVSLLVAFLLAKGGIILLLMALDNLRLSALVWTCVAQHHPSHLSSAALGQSFKQILLTKSEIIAHLPTVMPMMIRLDL
jgi:hypothetical protein